MTQKRTVNDFFQAFQRKPQSLHDMGLTLTSGGKLGSNRTG